jgi:hypothetical protein
MWCWWVWYHLLFFPPWSARLAHMAVKLAQASHVQAALFLPRRLQRDRGACRVGVCTLHFRAALEFRARCRIGVSVVTVTLFSRPLPPYRTGRAPMSRAPLSTSGPAPAAVSATRHQRDIRRAVAMGGHSVPVAF